MPESAGQEDHEISAVRAMRRKALAAIHSIKKQSNNLTVPHGEFSPTHVPSILNQLENQQCVLDNLTLVVNSHGSFSGVSELLDRWLECLNTAYDWCCQVAHQVDLPDNHPLCDLIFRGELVELLSEIMAWFATFRGDTKYLSQLRTDQASASEDATIGDMEDSIE